MRTFVRFLFWMIAVVVVLGGALLWYFVYTPEPEVPHLSGRLAEGVIQSGGRARSYVTYAPPNLAKGAPLVIAMHGSGENGKRMRVATGFGFERLADQNGFLVVYPNGFEGYWNACNIVGDYAANTLEIDDVGFLTALADKLAIEYGLDRTRVFAMGLSRGGAMALRLAIEAPTQFRALASVAASVPALDNFKCAPRGPGTPSVMIMNGTEDPLNPFAGGEVSLFGIIARGTVRSSRASVQYFADLNHIFRPPQTSETLAADGVRVERLFWRGDSGVEVELVALYGGGHVIPQAHWRYPRILGPTPKEPDGPTVMWEFFARQVATTPAP